MASRQSAETRSANLMKTRPLQSAAGFLIALYMP